MQSPFEIQKPVGDIARPLVSLWLSGNGAPETTRNLLNGSSVFVLAGGPSASDLDLSELERPGCLTMGLNNSPKTFRPELWVSVDKPSHFLKSIWLDPKITKFARAEHKAERIYDSITGTLTEQTAETCPNVTFFESDTQFDDKNFLARESVSWGTTAAGGGKSVLLAALKILFHLGAGNVFLLGVDFRMREDYCYHFAQRRSAESVKGNLATYEFLSRVLTSLKPQFDRYGFRIWNCNPDSLLTIFPHCPFECAVEFAVASIPTSLADEPSEGLYERVSAFNNSAGIFQDSAEGSISEITRIDRSKRPKVIEVSKSGEVFYHSEKTSGVLLLADENVEWLLPWWFQHFSATNPELQVAVADAGMGDLAIEWLRMRNIPTVPYRPEFPTFQKKWFCKPFVIADSPFHHTVFCDLDCEVRSGLSSIFGWSEKGTVLGRDLYPIDRYRKMFRERYYYNSGLIGVRKQDPIVKAWCQAVESLHRTFRSDQEILNLVLYDQEAEIVELPEGYHQLRLAGESSKATVMHWTGDAGKEHIRREIKRLGIPPLG